MSIWNNLPLDLLAKVFSFLSPDSLAIARSVCKNWHTCSKAYPLSPTTTSSTTTTTSSWFLALPIRNHRACCYAHNPTIDKWHQLSLPLPSIRPIASIGSLLLLRVTNSTTLQLGLFNPFTGEFKHLPRLRAARTNPAVGVKVSESSNSSHDDVVFPSFRVYVAGGMSEAAAEGGATYETKVEMYDSRIETWRVVGSTPVEFAVRLTVWTPNENVCIGETLYWVTSARAYSVVGYDVGRNGWRELGVPMAEKLEFASLVKRNGALGLVGGTCGGSGCIWGLGEGDDKWCLVDEVPLQLGLRLLGGKRVWESVKCVGNEDCICLYRDLGSGMVACRRVGCEWVWVWIYGCDNLKGKPLPNSAIRGALLHPTLASSSLIF
ncbi:F-box only protein 6-like [Vigna unguiculata]|uniref:Galactose oxidase n=1 Tax=Vigna unguiculata TaxID=3917 RepID=A0A4D6MKL8_VIGUN|nr:F-box only protein 6-like [Vigna unguiculata]QCE02100.1 Galactose oxidase [Vigna unguiculata]